MKEKIYHFINVFLIIIGIVTFFVLSIFSMRYEMLHLENYSEKLTLIKDSAIINLLFYIISSAILFCIAFLMTRSNKNLYRKAHIFAILTSVFIFLCGIYFVGHFHVLPGGDQAFLYTNASLFLEKSYDHICVGGYMDMYPHQYPLSYFYELLFSVTGAWNYRSIQYVQAFFAGIISYSGFHLCHELFKNEKADIIVSCLFIMCLPLYFYIPFVYGEIPSIAFLLLSLWMLTVFMKKKKIVYGVLFGICMVLSMLFRKHSMIFLIAAVLILLVYAWKENRISCIFTGLGTILLYVLCIQLIYANVQYRTGFEVRKGIPAVAFVTMGMTENEGGPGRFNGYNQYIYGAAEFDSKKAAELSKYDLSVRMNEFKEDPAVFVEFMKMKMMNQWDDPTFEGIVITDSFEDEGSLNPLRDSIYYGKWYDHLVEFMDHYQFLIYFSVLILFVFLIFKKVQLYQLVLFVGIFGEFLFSMVWEAKGRYIFPCFICMIPMAGVGIVFLYEKAVNSVKNLV